ncbi:TPA: methyltransferase [Stenotrophomonas maltophilia]|uniref:class I SAM-dependent methyltransferase n=1 Tax=Stenotrophomonas TaxID=40323 RepID=UPI0003FDCC4E|nr:MULTISPECIES: class I SAM-dependent methyltransferase [Stenotrophomonas]AVH93060.1 16S rRNA methyltransferase [Stenotrophomonas maltophilia]AYZ68653.1 16S rRNA methyltransferase [Stenotrophomonas maltophilia]EKT4447989.1 methyltransferase [Stenotrophomonas maltophilia]KOO72039.1 16S rRNA methyltransferase [Stenotrophomonas maltophilia]MBC9117339.1 methyltransferase [Stenotrophomonas maltophilia]
MASSDDAPLQTLFLPFSQGALRWPEGPVAFLRARDGWPLREVAGNREVHCEQSFAPFAQPLQQATGWTVSGQLDDVAGKGRYPLVLVLPPRQREEARALFARALALVADGGRIVACQSNNEGARSGEGDLKQLTGLGGSLTKNHCRVYWTAPMQGQHDADLAKRWSALDAVRPIVGGRFLSRPGVFAWDRIDPASALLAEHLPADLAGRAADLGAGYGYLSRELLERCPKITALDLYEAEQRALALAELNLAPPPRPLPLRFLWQDVTAGIEPGYDVIISNPPFHTPSRADRPDIGQRFIAVAAQALRPGGRLYVVANRHLPYEYTLNESFGAVRVIAERDGFKLVEAVKGKGK